MDASSNDGVSCSRFGRCDLYLDFVSIVIVSGVYLLYYLRFSFDFIIYVPSTIFFSYFGTGLPG